MDYPSSQVTILYVDTSSSDGSPEVARACGARVFQEHSPKPTAALARNRGTKEATTEIIHFVDGDMEMDPGYLQEAVRVIGKEGVACVFGRVQERASNHNLIANLLDYPWKIKKPGFIDSPGAGGTFLRSALQEVSGYNPNLARGEETDVGFRLHNCGYKILLIDHTMGTHDYGITTLAGVWGKYVGMGRHFGSLLWMNKSEAVSSERRTAVKFAVQGFIAFLGALFVVITTWWWFLVAAPMALFVYIILRYWQPSAFRQVRLGYFLMEYFFKPAIWWGMLQATFQFGAH